MPVSYGISVATTRYYTPYWSPARLVSILDYTSMDDLTPLLQTWPYDPEQTVRIIVAEDGRSVMQVRLPLGIEQYEMEGRPDGARPYGFDSILDHTEDRLKRYIVETGGDAGFHIKPKEAGELQAEGVLFYYRYLLLFQLQRFDSVIRDTEHNLHLCDILERYCENEDARNAVLQFQPYIIRMNAAAQALSIGRGDRSGDYHSVVEEAVRRIEELQEIDSPAFQFERIRSVNYLRTLARKLDKGTIEDGDEEEDEAEATESVETELPPDRRTRLEQELQEAVNSEDYERAAYIRDTLRREGFG